jgi:hypothetical protein
MGEITIKGFLCERCDHKWPPRNLLNPKPFVCPRCKSPYWNSPRKNSLNFKDSRGIEKELTEIITKEKGFGIFPKIERKKRK